MAKLELLLNYFLGPLVMIAIKSCLAEMSKRMEALQENLAQADEAGKARTAA